jgi:uncharacterized Tic20 family protein
MTETISKHERNLSGIIHASTLSKYFIPFGNFLLPLILWLGNKNEKPFVDYNGKQALNFQISILLYGIVLAVISGVLFLVFAFDFVGFVDVLEINEHNLSTYNHGHKGFGTHVVFMILAGILGLGLLALDIVCTILATIKGGNGEVYKYPITINFIR